MEKRKNKRRIRKTKGGARQKGKEAGREKTTEKMISCRFKLFFSVVFLHLVWQQHIF